MIKEYQIYDNYHVCGGFYYKYEIKDQCVWIQNYRAFTKYDFECISNSRRLTLDA
jgi:hypothetical protein